VQAFQHMYKLRTGKLKHATCYITKATRMGNRKLSDNQNE